MSEKRTAANRRNALKSTGPRTTEGKTRASMNALKHGLRASSLAVPVLEDPEDWEAHRSLVLRDLSPVGYLETVLSERAAAILWRLGRVVRYESDQVSIAIKDAETSALYSMEDETQDERGREETLARVHGLKPKAHVDGEDVESVLDLVAEALDVDLEDENVSAAVETPEGFTEGYWQDFTGWTREGLEAAVQSLKAQAADEHAGEDPWEAARRAAEDRLHKAETGQERRNAYIDRKRREVLLPSDETLEKVSRYETTLERSLFRTLHELQRLQAANRGGVALPPPAAVDVDVAFHQEK
jgi:hypothetical protein